MGKLKTENHKTSSQENQPDSQSSSVIKQVVEVIIEEEPETTVTVTNRKEESEQEEANKSDKAVTSSVKSSPESDNNDNATEKITDTIKENSAVENSTAINEIENKDQKPNTQNAAAGSSKSVSEETTKDVVEELFSRHKGERFADLAISGTDRKKNTLLWAFIIIVVAFVTSVLLLFASKKVTVGNISVTKSEPTPTAVLNAITPTIQPVIRSEVTVTVLNGGGVSGAAGKMKTFLTGKGYIVSGTGNTDEYSYTKTEIHVKPGQDQILEILSSDLKDAYVLGTTAADLRSSSDTIAEVIVGQE